MPAALAGGCHLGSLPCKGRWHRRKAMTEGCDALPVLYPRGSIMALPPRGGCCRGAAVYSPLRRTTVITLPLISARLTGPKYRLSRAPSR